VDTRLDSKPQCLAEHGAKRWKAILLAKREEEAMAPEAKSEEAYVEFTGGIMRARAILALKREANDLCDARYAKPLFARCLQQL
jgi:hypothetical protein